jgi:hypothetical protein
MTGKTDHSPTEDGVEAQAPESLALQGRALTPAAVRALAEAEARRQARVKPQQQVEIGGREGPDPARYGDWEVKGIASDF